MLRDAETFKIITSTPFQDSFKLIEKRMKPEEVEAARNALLKKIEGDTIHTAGWIPGADWRGTPFQAIYEKAAERNPSLAAKLFGLLVWDVFLHHDDEWFTGKYSKDGKDIGSRTYFKRGED